MLMLSARRGASHRVAAHREQRQIFQTHPPSGNITYADIVDAMHMVDRMPISHDRVEYCSSVGIDYLRVVEYYSTVRSLDATYNNSLQLRRPRPPLLPMHACQRETTMGIACKRLFILYVAVMMCVLVRAANNNTST